MEHVSRREVLRQLALSMTAAGSGVFNIEAARVVHALVAEERTQPEGYTLKWLSPHEFATVSRLAELIVPADEGGGSGVDAGAPEFIDVLCSQNDQLADIYRDGVAWCDRVMRDRVRSRFVEASSVQQTTLLDDLVVGETARRRGALRQGVSFFGWVRRMTVDAYYTSPIGIADLGYQGNAVLTSFDVPVAAIDFANRRIQDI
ncbi:MAG: gluconate 2-dehydrogenase subunit 3 family protein [Acidobacteriota bacterium]|nr:gluconate 2-dehydrogenase subunit 3 family protein [Acidobacteriota bacterium]